MQCETFESRCHDLLDRRELLEADVELAGHARECAACRELWSGLSLISAVSTRRPWGQQSGSALATRVLETLSEPGGSAGLAVGESVSEPVSALPTSSPSSGAGFSSRLGWGVAVAASIGLVIVLAFQANPGSSGLSHEELRVAVLEESAEPEGAADVGGSLGGYSVAAQWGLREFGLDVIGQESMEVVRPLAKPIHVAFDLIRRNVRLGGKANRPEPLEHDARHWYVIDVYA